MENKKPEREICETCPLSGKTEDDIKRYLEDVIDEYLVDRKITYEEIQRLSEILNKTIDNRLNKHKNDCPLKTTINEIQTELNEMQARQEGVEEAQESNRESLGVVVNVIIGVAAASSFVISLLNAFGVI